MSVPSDAELLRRAYEEVQRLRAELARVTPECVGCLHQGGPLEECPLHGREYAYWVDGCTELSEQVARLRAELAEHEQYLDQTMELAEERKAAIARVRELCVRYTSRAFPECMHAEEFLRALDGAE